MSNVVYPFITNENIGANAIVTRVNGIEPLLSLAISNTEEITLVGVNGDISNVAGDVADITIGGIGKVKLAGTVKFGDLVTCNTAGLGVKASPNTVGLVQTVGVALMGGVSGDIVDINVVPSRLEKI
jgi:hypothetical protein